MTTRIRYKSGKYNYGTLISDSFKTPENEYRINITSDFTYVIFTKDNEIVAENKCKNIAEAKKLAKQALIALGVLFESEVRPRIKNNEGRRTKEEVLKLYQDSINEDARKVYESENRGDK